MKELTTEIVIHADVSIVWNTLINLDQYSEWNPFITQASGKIKEGEQLNIQISLPGDEQFEFDPKVIEVDYLHKISWSGRLWVPGLFNGEHIFEIHVRGKETCVFRQREIFRGLLVPFIWNRIGSPTREGFNQMNQKLKKRAEAIAIKNRAVNVTRSLSNRVSELS
jgi:hypothetical protein